MVDNLCIIHISILENYCEVILMVDNLCIVHHNAVLENYWEVFLVVDYLCIIHILFDIKVCNLEVF